MKKTRIQYSILLLILMVFVNCKGKQGDPGPAGSTSNGVIKGIVTLTRANGIQPGDMSGVVVKTDKGDSTVTNISGAWSLNEAAGIYVLTFSKAGYGTTTINGYNFAGGGTSYINATALSQAPTYSTTVTLDTIGGSSTATRDLHVNVNFALTGTTPQMEDRQVFVYYSTNSSLSASNYMGMVSVSIPATQTSYKTTITGADFLNAGIQSGQTIYAVAYPSAATMAMSSKYINETTGKTIYTSLAVGSVVENYVVAH